MPLALTTIDRDLVKTLVLQGLRSDEIIRQTGVKPNTLKTWIKRYDWNVLKDKANALRESTVGMMLREGQQVAPDRGKIVRGRLEERLEQQTAVLLSKPVPRSVKAIGSESAALRPLVQNAKDVFGWSEQGPGGALNLANLKSAQVIDVTEVKPDVPQVGNGSTIDLSPNAS